MGAFCTAAATAIPINKAEAAAHLPTIIVAGLADTVVRWKMNGEKFVKELEAPGANFQLITKPGCDHHPHSPDTPAPVVAFIEENHKA